MKGKVASLTTISSTMLTRLSQNTVNFKLTAPTSLAWILMKGKVASLAAAGSAMMDQLLLHWSAVFDDKACSAAKRAPGSW